MKKIYVFDMGHVIIGEADLKRMYKESGATCDFSEFYNLFYKSGYTKMVYKGIINDNNFFKFIKDETGSCKSVNELKKLYLQCKNSVYKDTLEIIRRLKQDNNVVCLLSNLKEIDYTYLRGTIDINLFDKLFLSYRMGKIKPDEDIYKCVIETLGTNDFYFFDDTNENIETARKLGINAYQVTGNSIKNCFTRILKYNAFDGGRSE